jgi:STE24 endopeptidase
MARANGIPADNVYVFDASKQSKRISANVSGMFGTVRISLNDNLMNRATPEEIRAVLGHEMGHYVLNHVYKGVLYFAVIIVVGFAVARWAFDRLAARGGERWGIRGVADVAGLPLLAVIFSAYLFVLTPVLNTMVRSAEAEADMFGLNAAREPDGFAQAAVDLSEYRKMHPGPIEEFIFFDHPSGWNRIHRAMVWKGEAVR